MRGPLGTTLLLGLLWPILAVAPGLGLLQVSETTRDTVNCAHGVKILAEDRMRADHVCWSGRKHRQYDSITKSLVSLSKCALTLSRRLFVAQ